MSGHQTCQFFRTELLRFYKFPSFWSSLYLLEPQKLFLIVSMPSVGGGQKDRIFFFFSSIYFFLYFQLLKLNQLTTCVLSWTKLFSYKISSCPSPQIINSVCELTEQEQDFQQLHNKLESSEGKGTATTATEAIWDGTEPVNLLHRSLLV